ncbi:MAG: RND family efflux transporter MFP subunit [Paracoccaceae bacterium]|jgi:RND family efflux transporter MFP subunit
MIEQTTEVNDLITESSELDASNVIQNSRFRRLGIGLTLSVFAAIAIYYIGVSGGSVDTPSAASGPPPAPVVIAEVIKMTMTPHTVLPGTVISTRDSVIASEATGKVLSVALVGDIVNQGDVLAQIDPENAKQSVAQRKAAVARLSSLYQYHKGYFARVNSEDSKLGMSAIGIAELRSNMETAKADMQSAQIALKSAELDLNRTSIKAPFAGRVVSQSIQVGEYAQIGSSVVRLVDTINLEISARVPAALVQPLVPGSLLDIVGMGKSIKAPLRALVPVGDAVSRTMELRVGLVDSGLLVGSGVRVSLPSAQAKEVVAIPRDAIILKTNAQYVFVVDQSGIASRRDIELGFADRQMIEAIGNVTVGDTVIIRGGERLRDGQLVSWDGAQLADSLAVSVLQ